MSIIKRKAPHRHRVREHTRKSQTGGNYPVQKYMRGEGDKPKQTRTMKRRVVGAKSMNNPVQGNPHGNPSTGFFTVTLRYPRGPSEIFDQSASTYGSAINPALQRRESPDDPKLMKLREIK